MYSFLAEVRECETGRCGRERDISSDGDVQAAPEGSRAGRADPGVGGKKKQVCLVFRSQLLQFEDRVSRGDILSVPKKCRWVMVAGCGCISCGALGDGG